MKKFPSPFGGTLPPLKTIWQTATASCVIFLLASCQTFERQPLDLAKHDQEWRSLAPSSEKVQVFSRRLAKKSQDSSVFKPSDGLSLSEGKTIALVYNPNLRNARLKAGVAKAEADYAGVWDDPELSLDVLNITKSVPDPWIVGSTLSFTVPLSGRLQAEKKQADAALHAALDRVAEAEWQVTIELQKAWIDWSATKAELEETKKITRTLASIAEATEKLASIGEMPKTEAALFSIELTSQKSEIIRLEGELKAQEQEIRSILGLSPTAAIRLFPALSIQGWPASEKRLAKNNPTLSRLRSEYEVAERKLLREVRKQFPDLVIGPQAESDEGQWRLGFIGAIPLPIFNANKGGIAKAKAERELSQAAFETAYQRKIGKLAQQNARLAALASQRSFLETQLIPKVDRQVADAEKLLKLGEGGSLILLESLVRAHEAKLKIITIHRQTSHAKTDLQSLLGPTNF